MFEKCGRTTDDGQRTMGILPEDHWYCKHLGLGFMEISLTGFFSGMTLTFYTLLSSINCLHLPTFRSQASMVSEKSTVFNFSYTKA